MASVYKSIAKANGLKPDDRNGEQSSIKKNKQRVLILSSRRVTFRHRHLLNDLHALLPHSRKESKLDTKTKLYQLNELAELYNCNNIFFFEARKAKDLYLWISKPPNGPTVKFHLQNLHTMEELHFTGNCLKGSRPILSFSNSFDAQPHLKLIKELLTQVFGVPKGSRKSKPFVDHVMGFTIADNKIWIRCYQISESESSPKTPSKPKSKTTKNDDEIAEMVVDGENEISLVEIGPRVVLTPIIIQESSFGGPIIYENKEFVSPNAIRSELRLKKAGRHAARSEQKGEARLRRGEMGLKTGTGVKRRTEGDELNDIFR